MSLLTRHNLELAKLAPKEESRFTLNGILVQPKSTVVTDGSILIEVGTSPLAAEGYPVLPGLPPATDDWKPFVLPAADAATLARTLPKRTTIPILNCAAVLAPAVPSADPGVEVVAAGKDLEHATLVTTDLERVNPVTIRRGGQSFPNYGQLVAKTVQPGTEEFSINFNAANLAAVFDWIAKANGSKRGATHPSDCVLRFDSTNGYMRVDSATEAGESIMAIVSPARAAGLTDTTAGIIKELRRSGTLGSDREKAMEAGAKRLAKLLAQVAELESLLVAGTHE